ncbi:MAG TPA: GNAT family N-acyltransferase [Candidatus Acidoferrales bacterium]|nr:GNAT family N-acyltransferase [Candidatus Acidoferrales bacterium]
MNTQRVWRRFAWPLRIRRKPAVPRYVPPLEQGRYTVKLVTDAREFRDALRLRYRVFNVELREGLAASHSTGHDFDEFDAVVEHIIVKCFATDEVVGTYRLQTGAMAARNIGYYSEREFDFAPYEPLRHELLELGRACIEQHHRNTPVLTLLWKAIAQYALAHGCRYLIGCSSLTSQDAVAGSRVYAQMQNFLAPPELQTLPQPAYAFELCDGETIEEAKIPKLLRAYLAAGAQICAPPALDRDFRTIDFLTLLDLGRLPRGARARFMGE